MMFSGILIDIRITFNIEKTRTCCNVFRYSRTYDLTRKLSIVYPNEAKIELQLYLELLQFGFKYLTIIS